MLCPALAERIRSFFGLMNEEIDLSEINFTVKVGSIVETNNKTEALLERIIKDCGKNRDPEVLELGISEEAM